MIVFLKGNGKRILSPVAENLQYDVQHLPGALLEDLREELREDAFDPERFDLRVHSQAAIGLDEGRRERDGCRRLG